eukprot:CAMPEP_0116871188 /NCGR_PEP_ID=MMETSP0463-20121206/1423_1 /TAXON_ID=181622 /ORGANISM="Strombidinopsis sp, Strain SopsisLIS2011" /LENGTH=99 /DNA_ID=CAMNT_0004509129 /DNA_START=151 /DNA_END=450 /DNA_ORIENTATION=+
MDLFKNYYNLEPTLVQYLLSIILIPWSIKILWGVMADTVEICGSRKKSWLVINGIVQFTLLMVLTGFTIQNYKVTTFILTMVMAAGAFMDVIVDALMVI